MFCMIVERRLLLDCGFNIGYSNFRGSTLLKELNKGNLAIADDPKFGFFSRPAQAVIVTASVPVAA